MTVFENIGFGLRVRGVAEGRDRASASHELLQLVRLEGLRAALSRRSSPAGSGSASRWPAPWPREPQVLLLDEPFGALDAKVRQELRQWLRRLHDEIHVTSVFVTHDQEEAFEVADRVVVMNHGKIEQVGTPEEVFEHPANPFVMDFLGNVNVFHGRVERGKARRAGLEVAYPDYPHAEAREPPCTSGRTSSTSSATRTACPASRPGCCTSTRPARARRSSSAPWTYDLLMNAEISAERFAELGLKAGDIVHVSPRRVRVFIPNVA